MNIIDNCVTKVLKVDRIITDEELCFAVTVIDGYKSKRVLKTMRKSEVDRMKEGKYSWME